MGMSKDHQFGPDRSAEHGEPGFATCVPVGDGNSRSLVFENAFAREAFADSIVVGVTVDRIETGSSVHDRFQNRFGREITGVNDPVSISDGLEEMVRQIVADVTVGVRQDDEHAKS